MPKFYNLIFLLVFIPFLLYSTSMEDSLKTHIETSSGNDKIDIYLKLAEVTQTSSFKDAEGYFKEAIAIAEILGNIQKQIAITLTLGDIYLDHGEYVHAQKTYQSCLELSSKNNLPESKILSLIQIARFHHSLREFEKSIEAINRAFAEEPDIDDDLTARLLFWLGYNNMGLNNNEEALSFFQRSLNLYDSTNNSEQYIRVLIYVAKTYMNIGEYDTALQTDLEALELSKMIQDDWISSLAYNDIAWNYFKNDDFDKALEYNIKALGYRKKIDNQHAITSSLINIGLLYKNYDQTSMAIQYFNEALLSANKIMKFSANNYKKRCYHNLTEIHEQNGEFKRSLEYLKLYTTISDSINYVIKNDELNELETKYKLNNYKNKQMIIGKMQRQKNMFLLSISLIVALIVSFISFDKYEKRKKQNLALKKEIKERIVMQQSLDEKNVKLELMSSIMRHDIANGLAVIQAGLNIYFKNKDEQVLKDVYSKNNILVKLIQDIKNSKKFILSNSQLSIFSLNDIINKLKSKFNVEIIQKNNCSFLAINTISSVFENIISNAISHGNAIRIEIECETKGTDCEIKIKNNGTDIPPKIISRIFNKGFKHGNAANTGMGLSIVKNAMEHSGGSVSVTANKPQGAVFTLIFRKPDQNI